MFVSREINSTYFLTDPEGSDGKNNLEHLQFVLRSILRTEGLKKRILGIHVKELIK